MRETASPSANEWVKTSYTQDVIQPYAQVLVEKTGNQATTCTYGLKRIAAYTAREDGSALSYLDRRVNA